MPSPLLDKEKILRVLSEGGPLEKKLPGFEIRAEQQKMLSHLVDAFNQKGVALIEAGTGTGKSIAYLIPALLAATLWQERVVVSTHTISLQEQLLEKDLPLLMEALDIDIKAVLVKGMSNYVCLRKIEEMEFGKIFLSPHELEIFHHIENLSCHQGVGSKAELPFSVSSSLWEMVSADSETCNGQECPHYQQCYYMNARKRAQDAQLLIVNHHLLLADLALKQEEEVKNTPLPTYSRLIIDEAHHLGDIATEFFADRTSRLELLKILSKISQETSEKKQGKLYLIQEKLQRQAAENFSKSEIFQRLTYDLPSLRRTLIKEIAEVFQLIEKFQKRDATEENKLRLRPHHYQSEDWSLIISKKLCQLKDLLQQFSVDLSRLEPAVKEFDDERLLESLKGPLFDLRNFGKRLDTEAMYLEKFSKEPQAQDQIRWIEGGANISCVEASPNVSHLLLNYLFQPLDTVALLSATLTTQGSFQYVKERLGLKELKGKPIFEAAFESPFNYKAQALLLIPHDIPLPSSPNFLEHAVKLIEEALQASRGNAFILFTSYGMLKDCFDRLYDRLIAAKFYPLKQGDESRGSLLSRFIKQDRSVLFGTDSFWEGVDVRGEALRLVIIVKLPFKVPNDPLTEAKSELLSEKGKNPFMELFVPEAAIKLKQGFGRLIRNKKDRGCIICLDKRLITKSYGRTLLNSLPPSPVLTIESHALKDTMTDFYKKTYYLTK